MSLQFWIYVKVADTFLTAFFSRELGALPGGTDHPVSNEAEAGTVFTLIKAYRQVIIRIPDGYPHAIHRLLALSQKESDLQIHIDFRREEVQRRVDMGGDSMLTMHPHIIEKTSVHPIAELWLNKCQLLSLTAGSEESYVGVFKIHGGFEVDYAYEDSGG